MQFLVRDITLLSLLQFGLSQNPILKECRGGRSDVVFGFDSSNNVREHEFELQINFAKNMMRNMQVMQQETRFGAVTYGRTVDMITDLQDNSSQSRLDGAQRMKGRARVDEAIKFIRTKSFRRSSFRRNTTQIMILLIGSPAAKITRSKKEATRARQSGINIITIGIGDIDMEELRAIAGTTDGSNQYHLPSYSHLQSVIAQVALSACSARTNPSLSISQQACGNRQEADIVFFLDSAAVGQTNTKKVLDFLIDVTKDVDIGPRKVQVGLVTNGCNQKQSGFRLNQYKGRVAMERGLNTLKKGSTKQMLQHVRRDSFTYKQGGRRFAKKMAVVVLDDSPKDAVSELLQQARLKDVEVFVIQVSRQDMSQIFPQYDRLFSVSSFDDLPAIRGQFLQRICDEL